MRNYLTNTNGLDFFDRAFEDFFAPIFYNKRADSMLTDIKETKTGYELTVDMPGFEKEDINLTLENGYLTIQAKKEEKEEDEKYVRRERVRSYSRSYYVGDAITEEDIKAKYKNGTLKLDLIKRKEVLPQKKNIVID